MRDSGAFHVVFVGHDHGALDVAEGTLALTVGVSRGAAGREAAGGLVAPTDVARVGPHRGIRANRTSEPTRRLAVYVA
jgi:hypothetical protein